MIKTELWLPIPGYEGLYEVSDQGTVKSIDRVVPHSKSYCLSIKGKILAPQTHSGGYLQVALSKNGVVKTFLVHDLVLRTFVGPPPHDQEARHFPDPDKTNNKLCNLNYGTHTANMNDKVIHGTDNKGSKNGQAILTEKQVLNIMLDLKNRATLKEAAAKYKTNFRNVSQIKNGKRWNWLTKVNEEGYCGI